MVKIKTLKDDLAEAVYHINLEKSHIKYHTQELNMWESEKLILLKELKEFKT